MGSHGGATAEGQVKLLEGLGVTEDSIGIPLLSSMETVGLGLTEEGYYVHCDKFAFESDGIVPFMEIFNTTTSQISPLLR